MQQDILEKVFNGWGGLLKEMCERGMITYDIGTAKRFVVCNNLTFVSTEEARVSIIKRYFKAFAPATLIDCATFTGLKKSVILKLIEEYNIPLKTIVCEGFEYSYINDIS